MGKHWPWLMEMHLFYYKTDTTEQLLNKAGFNILRTEKYTHYVSYTMLCNIEIIWPDPPYTAVKPLEYQV